MGHRFELVAGCAIVGLAVAGLWGAGCAQIVGADDYKVQAGGDVATVATTGPTTGAGGDSTTGTTATTATTATTSTTATTGAGGAGGSGAGGGTCTAPSPIGHRMCGPGQTCNTDECGPPITYACFNAGTVTEGGSCITKADCAVGLTCLRYKLAHACRTLCAADADCPAGGYKCNEGFTCGTNTATAGKYCTKSCSDPSTVAGSAGCGQGFRCNFYCDATTHMSTPPSCDFEAGALKSGTCTDDEDCAAGYYCLSASLDGGTKVCTQGCRTNADCATGTCSGTLYCDTTPTQYHYCKVGG